MDKRISSSQEAEVRKGPWTMEEDLILINYITNHGEGVWNNIARSAGISIRISIIYIHIMRPSSPPCMAFCSANGFLSRSEPHREELPAALAELPPPRRTAGQHHPRGAAPDHGAPCEVGKQLPGRTDNEIKNFWRTRIQKKLKHGEPFGVQNVMLTDEASTSTTQVNTTTDEGAQPGAYTHMDDDQQTANPDGMISEFSTESSDNFWTVDDFWSMPSLNGD
ncbi:unnamed protein product [Musa hybrid cultivar]